MLICKDCLRRISPTDFGAIQGWFKHSATEPRFLNNNIFIFHQGRLPSGVDPLAPGLILIHGPSNILNVFLFLLGVTWLIIVESNEKF